MIFGHGREIIYTNNIPNGDIEHDKRIIPLILIEAMPRHNTNRLAIKYLTDVYYNKTDIQNKVKTSRKDINNKISIPEAMKTIVTINSYCFSSPFKYVSREAEKVDSVKALNDALEADGSYNKFGATTLNCGICGLGYRYVSKPTQKEIEEGIYFKTDSEIDPMQAFCVYENSLNKNKVLGVYYHNEERSKVLDNGSIATETVTVFDVFTKWHRWIFENVVGTNIFTNVLIPITLIGMLEPTNFQALPYIIDKDGNPVECTIPLIEYVRKYDRTSDFELAILLSNAIDTIISNSVDCIAQNVDYVFKFRDIDIGEWDENGKNPVFEKIQQALLYNILAINSNSDSQTQPDIDILEVPLNQSQVVQLINLLYSMLQEVTFIPNRNSSSGGADTNSSVETRNGFRSLEDIAGIITSSTLIGEKEFLKCALEIARNIEGCPFADLKCKDVEIKPMRNKIESIINQTQAFATMIHAGVNRVTAYVVSGLVADPTDTAKMDELERDVLFQETLKQQIEQLRKQKEVEQEFSTNNSQQSNNDKQSTVKETTEDIVVDEPKTE